MYDVIFFDLDGTLSDPGLGITNSVMHALKYRNIEVKDRSELYMFIGPPLIETFMEYCRISRKEAEEMVPHYREYFSEKGLYENEMYEGIPALLTKLKAMGKRLAVATSKPDLFSVEILKHFGIYEYFEFVGGATMQETRTRKEEVIEYVLESMGIEDRSRVLMIGDREHDILGAKKCGLHSLGVLYGYGDREELSAAGADHIAEAPEDILKFV